MKKVFAKIVAEEQRQQKEKQKRLMQPNLIHDTPQELVVILDKKIKNRKDDLENKIIKEAKTLK